MLPDRDVDRRLDALLNALMAGDAPLLARQVRLRIEADRTRPDAGLRRWGLAAAMSIGLLLFGYVAMQRIDRPRIASTVEGDRTLIPPKPVPTSPIAADTPSSPTAVTAQTSPVTGAIRQRPAARHPDERSFEDDVEPIAVPPLDLSPLVLESIEVDSIDVVPLPEILRLDHP